MPSQFLKQRSPCRKTFRLRTPIASVFSSRSLKPTSNSPSRKMPGSRQPETTSLTIWRQWPRTPAKNPKTAFPRSLRFHHQRLRLAPRFRFHLRHRARQFSHNCRRPSRIPEPRTFHRQTLFRRPRPPRPPARPRPVLRSLHRFGSRPCASKTLSPNPRWPLVWCFTLRMGPNKGNPTSSTLRSSRMTQAQRLEPRVRRMPPKRCAMSPRPKPMPCRRGMPILNLTSAVTLSLKPKPSP